jgi:hypothetical protein
LSERKLQTRKIPVFSLSRHPSLSKTGHDVMAQETGQSVTIAIRRPTDTPSVFVTGNFSDPAWEPFELTAKPVDPVQREAEVQITEYLFARNFHIPKGQYLYRFHLGSDDSWFLDDSTERGMDQSFIFL